MREINKRRTAPSVKSFYTSALSQNLSIADHLRRVEITRRAGCAKLTHATFALAPHFAKAQRI
jgi:hypothetical protein